MDIPKWSRYSNKTEYYEALTRGRNAAKLWAKQQGCDMNGVLKSPRVENSVLTEEEMEQIYIRNLLIK